MHDILFENLRFYPMSTDLVAGMGNSIAVTDGRFSAVGETVEAKECVDLGGRLLMPGFIDCHTHLLYAGNRMKEHAMRLSGASYEEIARAGGGILSTVRAVRDATIDDLVEQSIPRAQALIAEGVTTIEIKSGYGLEMDSELKMLRAIKHLDSMLPVRVRATFLGAHAVPEGRERRDYLNEVCREMLPVVADEGLADSVDIFVESIAFGLDDLCMLAESAEAFGLSLRVHAEQLSAMGATRLAAELKALSCDHLEYASADDARAMGDNGTVAVLLPGAFYFLGETRKPPIDLLRQHGVPMAIASDINPGSSPIVSLLTNLHMASTIFGLTPTESLTGITRNAARAMGLAGEVGEIVLGARADFSVWDLESPEYLLYQLGGITPQAVFVDGVKT
ncbi:MAG: imidazolonepropionase [Gammaproteobacteria bacterium]